MQALFYIQVLLLFSKKQIGIVNHPYTYYYFFFL